MSKEILLNKGYSAIVDDADHDWLMQWRWTAIIHRSGLVYAHRRICANGASTFLLMHRQIMNTPVGVLTDHRNGNGLDNQRHNLRYATKSQNAMNAKPRKGTSDFKGVHWHRASRKWAAAICVQGKIKHLGLFLREEEAAAAYAEKASEVFGEFMRLVE